MASGVAIPGRSSISVNVLLIFDCKKSFAASYLLLMPGFVTQLLAPVYCPSCGGNSLPIPSSDIPDVNDIAVVCGLFSAKHSNERPSQNDAKRLHNRHDFDRK